MATEKYVNDLKLIDGNRVVRGHKTEFTIGEFAVRELEKIKVLSMHIALDVQKADTLLDCLVDELLSSGNDMREFEDKLEDIGHFLEYLIDRLPETVQDTDMKRLPDDAISDTEESIYNPEESIPKLELTEEAWNQPF
ncbi:hypothetical protein AALB51_20460 [Lachnospiraceae bacterium 62-26]